MDCRALISNRKLLQKFSCAESNFNLFFKRFLEKLGPENLHKLLDGFEDKSAQAICTMAFARDENSEVILFKGITEGKHY